MRTVREIIPTSPPEGESVPPRGGAENHFRTDYLKADLRRRTIRGGAATLISQGCKFLLQLASVVALARLLRPEDYGLFAVVFAAVSFFALFKELGLPTATVQSAEINHAQVSTLFWINVAAGCTLALVTATVAPVVGWLYGEPRLVWATVALGGGFVFVGLSGQHRALLRRQMRFVALATVDIISFGAGLAVAVVAAFYGARYWALVLMQLTMGACEALGLWLACDWRPSLPRRRTGVRRMLAFGSHLTGYDIISYLTRNADNLLIGWYWGARSLGLYDKAYQLLLLPTMQIAMPVGSIAIPVLSRLQDEPRRYREYFERCILLTAACGMPLVAFLFVMADVAIPFVLGAQWEASIPLFRALAPAAFLGTLNSGMGWAMVSLGRTRRQFKWSIAVTALTLASFLVGVRWGAIGVAIAFSACRVLTQMPTVVYCCKDSPLRWTRVLEAISRPALAAIVAAIVLASVVKHLPTTPLGALAWSGLIYCSVYLAVWLVVPDRRHTLAEAFGSIKDFWWARGAAKGVSNG